MRDIANNLSVGERIGKYQILAMAGAGGMGVVYKALDTKLERTVALKFLPHELNVSEKEKERFLKEARTASQLDHPHIGVIHGIEETSEGSSFIVMAFYEGESLSKKIRRGPLTFHEAVDIAIQMADGLAEAHSRNIVHRDIKPSNVMITGRNIVKIVDFGLARVVSSASMSQTGGTTGTMGYMSPEQTLGKPVDHRTDIWALGVVFAEMLTGQNPFHRDSAPTMVVAIMNEPPLPLDGVPADLQQIVYRALSKDAAHRYQSCAEFRAELEKARALLPAPEAIDQGAPTLSVRSAELKKYIEHASNSAWIPATQRQPSSLRWWLAGAGIVVLALLCVLLIPSLRDRLPVSLFASSEKHIAVLPFDNIGNNPANEEVAEGLMDSLTSALSNLDVGKQSLWVVPSSVVRGSKVTDPAAALRELGATFVVKGSIARDGQDVHLTINLIDTTRLRQVGSVALDDRAGDLASLQDEAVSRIARMMNIAVTPDMLRATGGSVTPAAYEGYLKALGYLQRYDKPGNVDQAISSLSDSVKTDPRFALGYAELGEAYRLKYVLEKNPKWIQEALANGQKAAELDDRLPAAFVTLGLLHTAAGNHDLAVQEFQHALQLNPRDPKALSGLARTYERSGRIADAEETFQKAAALRPDYWDGYNNLGLFYDRQEKYPQSIAQFQHAAELTPDNAQVYSNLGAAYIDSGDPKNFPLAEGALKKSVEFSPSYAAYANLGALYYNERRFADAAAMMEKAVQLNDQDYMVWNNLLTAYQILKQRDKANAARARLMQLLEQRVKASPQDAMAEARLGVVYAEENLHEKALERVQAALALSPDDPTILASAGIAYEDIGNRPVAISYIEKALNKGYSFAQVKDEPDLQNLFSDPNFHPTSNK
jgi:serine/threonine protein kinase/tetratricopeptide (TPR) repeat protein